MTASSAPSAAPSPPAPAWMRVFTVALTTWLGVHALRTFFAMIVWNIAEDRPSIQIGLIALVFWGIGMLAWPLIRRLGGSDPAQRIGLLFGAAYTLHTTTSHPVLTPALGVATGILWLWIFPALIAAWGRRGAADTILPGVLLGLAAQVALQTTLHGLDMPVLHGLRPAVIALLLAAGLYLGLATVAGEAPGAAGGTDGREGYPGWGLAALGPFLLLQISLLTNLGRMSMLTGWGPRETAGQILVGLAAAAAVLSWPWPYAARAAAAILAVAGLMLQPAWPQAWAPWLLLAEQLLLAAALTAALLPARGGSPRGVFGWFAAGAMIFFVLTFLYYRRYGWPDLWAVMAGFAVIPALIRQIPAVPHATARQVLAAVIVVAVAGLIGASVPPRRGQVLANAPAELKVLNYNVHEIFNAWSVPGPEATARVIEQSGADLVALQEIGRGWNINGGTDMVAWLTWRFPQYQVIFAPILGDLVGLAILSRYTPRQVGWILYPERQSSLSYGLQWVTIPTAAGDLLFVNTHFSPYAQYAADRAGQAADLVNFWKGRNRTIVVGDLNAGPEEVAIKYLRGAGLVDSGAPHGLSGALSYPCDRPDRRLDYILTSPEIVSLAAAIPRATASDHCPVEARLRLR